MIDKMLQEVRCIPEAAMAFLGHSTAYRLDTGIPYLGMGSSYFAPLAFRYMGLEILPEIASEYYMVNQSGTRQPHGVILSQSGRSSEGLWCRDLFRQYTAITNDPASPLASADNVDLSVDIMGGDEAYSSSKTYINTLLALFRGFGMDPSGPVRILADRMEHYEEKGEEMARIVYDLITTESIHGIYITGSGPDIATAYEASLILSESTKRCFPGLPMAQYDHGPKETSSGSIAIQIIPQEQVRSRTIKLSKTIAMAGAHVLTVEEPEVNQPFSILHHMVPFNFMACYLADLLDIRETFVVGGKVTETD